MSLPKAQVSHLHKGEVDSHLSRLSTPPYLISPPLGASKPPGWVLFTLIGPLILLRNNQFVALAMDVDDLDLIVVLQMLTQFGDVNIH